MGSGKFTGSDIQALTDLAAQAFENTFGKVEAAPAPQAPYRAAPGHIGSTAREVVQQASAPAFTKPFNMWGGDKAYLGKKEWEAFGKPMPEVTWGEWVSAASSGDDKAKSRLEYAAKADPGTDPKWKAKNLERIAKARACLNMIASGYTEPQMPSGDEPQQF